MNFEKRSKLTISLFEEALKFKPQDWGIIANKGDCFFKMKRYDLAKDQYNMAYNFTQKNPAIAARIGLCCSYFALENFNGKKYLKALQQIDEALTWDPKNPEHLCLKGRICILLNDAKKAYQAYKAAIIINPKQKEAMAYMAQFPTGIH